ncbi:MAG: hypothetical protein R3193_09135, partial [Marinobacter sp.]|nr:hypothetical protein [Marinobacter sp.]
LVMEFGVSLKAIQRIDRRGAVFNRYNRLEYETVQALHRRRQLYWQARDLHDKHFSRKVIAERYDIDMTTIKRYAQVMQDEQRQVNQELRRAA